MVHVVGAVYVQYVCMFCQEIHIICCKDAIRLQYWRSGRASVLMERLQQRINDSQREELRPRVPNVEGVPSERQMPKHNVAWALTDIEPAIGG